jgi:4-diphosphocytidyl-2-C-methyl-D-erythritol kinase
LTLTITCHAKVNLTLDVLAKRPNDGYHDLVSVMVPISLGDQIRLTAADDIRVLASPAIPGPPETNLALRAALLLKAVTGYSGGALIELNKVIPIAGGLAGGSTNAAAVLRGLNQLWRTGLKTADLVALAIQLGSDVPFFITEQPARVEGIGERLSPLLITKPLWLVLATPAVAKSTSSVFRLFDELELIDRPDTAAMERALAAGDLSEIAAALGNVFEQVMLPRHPEIGLLKRAMIKEGALGALMSGAGPTVFGLMADEPSGRRLLQSIRPLTERTFLVHTADPRGW